MNHISLDLGAQDVCLTDIAEKVASDCAECDLLEELARANRDIARDSKNERETNFALDAAKRLTDLSKWFKENAP